MLDIANREQVLRLKEGIESWNEWRLENPRVTPDLRSSVFMNCDLRKANLANADLSRAFLVGADLSGACLARANLFRADFVTARLEGADLTRANLSYTNLASAKLSWADLTEASLGSTVLGGVDLRDVMGLESIRHNGPSHVDTQTFYRSNGEIPDIFLRGCGVPEDMISFVHGIRGAIQFYSCFISYSTKDEEFASRLHNDLQASGVRCWYAPHDVRAGLHLHDQIDQAIRIHNKDLLILSPNSIESEWVKTETIKARNREVEEKTRVLFPVRLCDFSALEKWKCVDTSTGVDHAHEVREYFIPDFSDWTNPASYKVAFEKLLRDLKPSA